MDNQAAIGAVALYTALNIVVLYALSIQTGRLRMRHKILMGDGGHPRMIRVMRGHANAIETMPMTLIALALAALLGAAPLAIHGLGLALTIGRALHAIHFMAADAPRWQRGLGFVLTAISMALAGLYAGILGIMAL
ncbi:MAG: MAPEG family protein [Fulvimarina manganoxydans]|uniref:MAPEG family protein n=1 Tax=Fulvimarina manganoxydans TaxID=937218 RepID=UPI00235525F4|nr:MAPEG family protein [Fulvimarina manganoxydans]MCK5930655.1 MAPEG family protein [Fulvimarina manganoxydans]MEE2951554.1 MAPEG family protein [Pseudomonadota bacterium]